MERQVAKALKESPFRNVLQQLMVLSNCHEKKKRKKAIKNLPSLPWLIEDLKSFMCVEPGENPGLELSIKKHPRTFLRVHMKMFRGLLRVFQFHVHRLYGESKDLVVYGYPGVRDFDDATDKDNDDTLSEDSFQYSVASTESWKSWGPRSPSPFPSPFRSAFDPPRISPSPLPQSKRQKVAEPLEMIVDIGEDELSQLLQRTPEEIAKVTMEEDFTLQFSRNSSFDSLDKEIQQEFFDMTIEFRRKLRASDDEDASSSGSSSFESVVMKKPFPRMRLPWELEPAQEQLLGMEQAPGDRRLPAVGAPEESMVLPEWLPHTVPQSSPKSKTWLQHTEDHILPTGALPEVEDQRREGEPVVENLSPIVALQPWQPRGAEHAPFQVFQDIDVPPRPRRSRRNRRDKVNKRKTHIRHSEYLARRDRPGGWHTVEPVLSSLLRPKKKVPRKYPSRYIESRVVLESRWMTEDNNWDLSRTEAVVRDPNVEERAEVLDSAETSDEEDWETMEQDGEQIPDDVEWDDLEFEAVDFIPPNLDGIRASPSDLALEVFRKDDWLVFQNWKDNTALPEDPQFPKGFRHRRAPCVSLAVCQMFPDWSTRRHPDEVPAQPVIDSIVQPEVGASKEFPTRSGETPLAVAVMSAGLLPSRSRVTMPSQSSLMHGLTHNLVRIQVSNKETGETREFLQTDLLNDIYEFAGRNVIEISVTMPSSQSAVCRVSSVRDEARIGEPVRIQELGPDGQIIPEVPVEEMHLVAPEVQLVAPADQLLAPEVPLVAPEVPVIQDGEVEALVPPQPPVPVEEFPFVVPVVPPRRPRRRRVRVYDEDDTPPRPPRRRRVRRNVPVPAVPGEAGEVAPVPEPLPEQEEAPLEIPAGVVAPPEPMETAEIGVGVEEAARVSERMWSKEAVIALLKEKIKALGTVVRFSDCCPPGACSKKSAASFFQTLLGLWQEDLVQLRQTDPAGDPSQMFIEGFDNVVFQID